MNEQEILYDDYADAQRVFNTLAASPLTEVVELLARVRYKEKYGRNAPRCRIKHIDGQPEVFAVNYETCFTMAKFDREHERSAASCLIERSIHNGWSPAAAAVAEPEDEHERDNVPVKRKRNDNQQRMLASTRARRAT